jgi:hypothetical protein
MRKTVFVVLLALSLGLTMTAGPTVAQEPFHPCPQPDCSGGGGGGGQQCGWWYICSGDTCRWIYICS